jgi:hypothetical protein
MKPETRDRILPFIEAGDYRELQEFIEVAVLNQIALEESHAAVLPQPRGITTPAPASSNIERTTAPTPTRDLWAMIAIPPAKVDTVRAPSDERFAEDRLGGELSGLYNRIGPAIVVTRALANLAAATGSVTLKNAHATIGVTAAVVGEKLATIDNKNQKKRGEKLATAFPAGTDEKALMRFQNHFIGTISRENLIAGLSPRLLFTNIERVDATAEPTIGITKAGLAFAQLPSGLDADEPEALLSPEQVNFILEHIRDHLPRERDAMATIMAAIEAGTNTPTTLDEVVKERHEHLEWTVPMVSTQRTGAVSRMNELGLITVQKDGVNSSYHLTDAGREYFATLPKPKNP